MKCTNLTEDARECGDEGILCDTCFEREMKDHEYLRHAPRTFGPPPDVRADDQELRDAGRGHLVRP